MDLPRPLVNMHCSPSQGTPSLLEKVTILTVGQLPRHSAPRPNRSVFWSNYMDLIPYKSAMKVSKIAIDKVKIFKRLLGFLILSV